jgi:uncharacterized protein (DUF433 family)
MAGDMATRITDRGRGPEIEGTRVTVYRILDYVREGSPAERMAAELDLTSEQVQAALAYIADHRQAVEAEYEQILLRAKQANPAWVDAARAKTPEELRQRILARQQVIEEFKAYSKRQGRTLGSLSIREMIEDGRRF